MTTIFYNPAEKAIAYDSRIVDEGVVVADDVEKKETVTVKGMQYQMFSAGPCADIAQFLKDLREQKTTASKEYDHCVRAIATDGSDVWDIYIDRNGCIKWDLSTHLPIAIGSGKHFALAASDFGKSAEESVAYACTRDIFSGGTIRSYGVL